MALCNLVLLFVCGLALPAAVNSAGSARLRGRNFDDLENLVRNPKIDAHIRGKTLKDLGIEENINNNNNNHRDDQARRKTADDGYSDSIVLNFFSVYDEFMAANFTTLGETAGSRAMIYNLQAKDDGLLEQYVEGALQGTCALVSSDGKQLCSYEFFLMDPETSVLSTIVATGTVMNEVGTNSVLIIEGTGDDKIGFSGGMVVIKYTAIGDQTVMDLDMKFRR